MARTRTAARVCTALAALPMAVLFIAGVAQADPGEQVANRGASVAAADLVGSGVGRNNHGISTTEQQVAAGRNATNQANTASVSRSGHTAIRQDNIRLTFYRMW
ncbi:hypothetical protein AB0K09_16805 [Streptomyces sp. NPDC049577]|uniref:hypothetical protein n=1 Tax=Streptomyces sp. NPDC049577 TaxID=3155153 RepID=UPI0034203F7E